MPLSVTENSMDSGFLAMWIMIEAVAKRQKMAKRRLPKINEATEIATPTTPTDRYQSVGRSGSSWSGACHSIIFSILQFYHIFPGQAIFTEVTIAGSLTEDWLSQIKSLYDCLWSEVEVFLHNS